ncbi:AcrR family transcriptional regulator [Natronobacillus azotifigens]|uniref:TetR/AcrR family transcriptional regulator n=1 Tax=Natronobacillus azotifigens TaxID=472978 RepID=A0A9J6RBM1_9BACI|nr:TetR/AcrR family transcriptional regulator [Natronobacillus azotifigens]MCZ0702943.1 TetR/AcrR family transcriptional regulator [Natronobacillus azotifigens]
MSPRKRASEELTKDMIIQEAQLQFEKKNFRDVSMRNIAKNLGCSHGAIYYHFKNKADLFFTIIEQYFSKLNKLIDETIQDKEDDQTKLKKLFLAFIAFGLNHQSQYELMFMLRNEEVDALSQQAANNSYRKFAEAVQHLASHTVTVADIWASFLALHGFVSYYRGSVKKYEEAEVTAEMHVNFLLKNFS